VSISTQCRDRLFRACHRCDVHTSVVHLRSQIILGFGSRWIIVPPVHTADLDTSGVGVALQAAWTEAEGPRAVHTDYQHQLTAVSMQYLTNRRLFQQQCTATALGGHCLQPLRCVYQPLKPGGSLQRSYIRRWRCQAAASDQKNASEPMYLSDLLKFEVGVLLCGSESSR
jgi:hypothetical protein